MARGVRASGKEPGELQEEEPAEVDWADLGEKLVGYTVWLARNRCWGCREWDNLGMGCSPEDLVREVISDFVTGRCDFDSRQGGLLAYLKQRIRWRFSNLQKARRARREAPEVDAQEQASDGSDWERQAIARQYLARLRQRVQAYGAERKRKFDLLPLYDAIVEQADVTVADLERRLEMSRDQVYYQLRVLRQLAQELGEEEA